MVRFGGVNTLKLFDLDTILMSFSVFKFSAITMGSYCKTNIGLISLTHQEMKAFIHVFCTNLDTFSSLFTIHIHTKKQTKKTKYNFRVLKSSLEKKVHFYDVQL